MNLFKAFWNRLRSLWQRREVKREIDEELRFHLEQRTAENIAAGMSLEDAAREARKRFGNVQSVREECREARGASFGDALMQDIRFGLRMLRKHPGFTVVAVFTLGLGLTLSAAVFCFVNDFFLRPLPARDPERLVVIAQKSPGFDLPYPFSYPDLTDFREMAEGGGSQAPDFAKAFSGVMGYKDEAVHLSRNGVTERVFVHAVSGNYFDVLGVQPLRGRVFLPGEGRNAGADPIIVLTHETWRTRFGADPNIVGQSLKLNGVPLTIVGVTPPGFLGAAWGTSLAGFVPATMLPELSLSHGGMIHQRGSTGFFLMGRLQPGATIEQARAVMEVAMSRLVEHYPNDHGPNVKPVVMREIRSRPSPFVANYTPLVVSALMAMSILVLAIAAANVANSLHARAAERERELAIRGALGASRERLLRQLLMESVLLALFAGIIGTVAAVWLNPYLNGLAPSPEQFAPAADTGTDWRLFAFTFGASLATGILTGLLPSLKATRLDLLRMLKDGAGGGSRARHPLRRLLLAGQVSLSCVVLICAGLALRSLQKLSQADLGFRPDHLFLASFDLSLQRYSVEQGRQFHSDLLQRVRNLPGIRSASLSSHVPFDVGGSMQGGISAADRPDTSEDARFKFIPCLVVGEAFLETLQFPIQEGRDFTARDDRSAPKAAIVSRSLAGHLWPGESALGKRLLLEGSELEVVGVVGDGRYWAMTDRNRPLLFQPLAQNYRGATTLVVRTEQDPSALAFAVQEIFRKLDPDLPLHSVRTMDQQLARSPLGLMPLRMGATLASAQGAMALLLAALGIFGLVSLSVTQRRREIGIRMAVGATRTDILRFVARQSLKPMLIGLVLGLFLAFGITRLLTGLLYGVSPADPFVFVSVTATVVGVTLLGAWIPLRRAIRVNPVEALRCE